MQRIGASSATVLTNIAIYRIIFETEDMCYAYIMGYIKFKNLFNQILWWNCEYRVAQLDSGELTSIFPMNTLAYTLKFTVT